MSLSLKARFDWVIGARVAADIILVSLAYAAGLGARFSLRMWSRLDPHPIEYKSILQRYIEVYFSTWWVLAGVCLIVFALSGFYTYGRSYGSRYKTLIIVKAVSLGYLISGVVLYILMDQGVREVLGITDRNVPRGAFFLSWLSTLLLVTGSRFWSAIWRKVLQRERQQSVYRNRQEPENILVIGGAGYIGSALLPRLLDRNYKVRLLDILLFGEDPIADLLGHPNLELIRQDFRRIDRVAEAMQGMDTVVHLGGIVGDPACDLNENLTIDINLIATRMIAELAHSKGIERFVFASTCSVYGESNEILDEQSRTKPVSLYGRTKLAAEQMLLGMTSPGFGPIILRFGTVYGLSGRLRFDLVVNLLVAKALKEGEITIIGGNQWRPFIHVKDAARAIHQVIEAPSAVVKGEIFNVGSNDQNYQIDTIGEIVQRVVPTATVVHKGDDTGQRNYRVNFDKIHNLLRFTPEWTVERGMRQVVESFENGRIRDYRDKAYSNSTHLTDEGTSQLVEYAQNWVSDYVQGASKQNRR